MVYLELFKRLLDTKASCDNVLSYCKNKIDFFKKFYNIKISSIYSIEMFDFYWKLLNIYQ